MTEKKNVGFVLVSFDLLAELLQLDSEIKILNVQCSKDDRHFKRFELYLESKDIPERRKGNYFPLVELLGDKGKKTKILKIFPDKK